MKKSIFAIALLLGAIACNTDEGPTPVPPAPTYDGFEITVHADKLTAWSVVFDICPKQKEATYYYDIISKARWEQTTPAQLQAEIAESIEKLAEMSQTSYEETLDQMLFKGDMLNTYSGAGYRAETDFYIYAFYWDVDGPAAEVALVPFRTPAVKASSESVDISFEEVDPYSLTVVCDPSLGVVDYYLIFDEATKVEALLSSMEDENALLSYQAMNYGQHLSELQSIKKQGLKPETRYTALVMAIDSEGNRFSTRASQQTPKVEENQRVESELFEELLGEWSGRQMLNDPINGESVSEFNVTIVAQVEDYDYDYRAHNQVVALVDGWSDLKYYGVKELEQEYASLEEADRKNPTEVFGPKWVIDIAEGDQLSMDGRVRQSVFGWYFLGDCYLLNTSSDFVSILTNRDFEVALSEDGNTLTISSPADMPNCYPSLCYQFETYGWMTLVYGGSEITLTRK